MCTIHLFRHVADKSINKFIGSVHGGEDGDGVDETTCGKGGNGTK